MAIARQKAPLQKRRCREFVSVTPLLVLMTSLLHSMAFRGRMEQVLHMALTIFTGVVVDGSRMSLELHIVRLYHTLSLLPTLCSSTSTSPMRHVHSSNGQASSHSIIAPI